MKALRRDLARAALFGWMIRLRAARSSSDDASRSAAAPPAESDAVRTFFSAVRRRERNARLRSARTSLVRSSGFPEKRSRFFPEQRTPVNPAAGAELFAAAGRALGLRAPKELHTHLAAMGKRDCRFDPGLQGDDERRRHGSLKGGCTLQQHTYQRRG